MPAVPPAKSEAPSECIYFVFYLVPNLYSVLHGNLFRHFCYGTVRAFVRRIIRQPRITFQYRCRSISSIEIIVSRLAFGFQYDVPFLDYAARKFGKYPFIVIVNSRNRMSVVPLTKNGKRNYRFTSTISPVMFDSNVLSDTIATTPGSNNESAGSLPKF